MVLFCLNRGNKMSAYLNTQNPNSEIIRQIREMKLKEQQRNFFNKYHHSFSKLRFFSSKHLDFRGSEIIIGDASELNSLEKKNLKEALNLFKPWKKGPFNIFGNFIDAEWRSDWKWDRILPHCPDLTGKTIADIGCHNGYYMYRMAAHNPALVVGFEPVIQHQLCFELLQKYAQTPNLVMEPLGIEHIDLFPNFFDIIFCLGILYHHTDPIGLLRKMYTALKPGSHLIIDCQGIASEDSVALVPDGPYAGSRGMWFLPSLACLLTWLRRSGFHNSTCFYQAPLSTEEQRSTTWAPIKSLSDFLSPTDDTKTVEGYPRPWRFYVKAVR